MSSSLNEILKRNKIDQKNLYIKSDNPLSEEELEFVYRDSMYEQNIKRWKNTYKKAYINKDKK